MSDNISRADAIEAVRKELVCDGRHETHDKTCRFIADVLLSALPSADAEQETVPTVVRVTMSDGSQYYLEHERDALQADAVQGEWKHTITWQPYCSNCEYVFGEDEEFSPFWKYCPMCGARMKGGAE